jgi:hypothetical protein
VMRIDEVANGRFQLSDAAVCTAAQPRRAKAS